MNKKKSVPWQVKRIFLNRISTEEFLLRTVRQLEKSKAYFGQTTNIQKNLKLEEIPQNSDKTNQFQKETRIFQGDEK